VDTMQALALRAEVIAGRLRGEALRQCILRVPPRQREGWVDTLLGLAKAPPDEPLPRGSVPYLPAGVHEILSALGDLPVRPSDVFVDVGSGLGRVVLLAHLLTGATAHGIEIQGRLVRAARQTATELGLSAVSFQRADASDARLEGTVFFLYSPLTGEALRRVLFSLQDLASKQELAIVTVGLELNQERWLTRRERTNVAVSYYDAGPNR
jgi:SAM-dependent methyltransferase